MTRKKGLQDDPLVQFLVGLGLSAVACYVAKKVHDGLSIAEKRQWREEFPVHHGEVGIPVTLGGVLSGNPLMTGAGLGLVLSDLDDKDEWFRRKQRNELY